MEIICPACGKKVLARVEPVYDGFRKVGESMVCSSCGGDFEAGEVALPPPDAPPASAMFTDQDRETTPVIFSPDERRHSCAWCRHFIVNPFTQRCGLSNRFTEATDCCDRFEPAEGDS